VTGPAGRSGTDSAGRAPDESAGQAPGGHSGRAASEFPGRAASEPGARVVRPAVPIPRFTPRAAILALVICSIALSLAYPVREYIAQRRQIDRLLDRRDQIGMRLRSLERERRQLNDPVYIERLARDRLHMCLPTEMCYTVIQPATKGTNPATARQASEPWYAKLWSSVQQANKPLQPRTRGPAVRRSAARRSGRARNG